MRSVFTTGLLFAFLIWPPGQVSQSVMGQIPPLVQTTPQNCSSPVNSDTTCGVAAASAPGSNLFNRRFVTFCNSNENAASTLIKIRIDGTNPVMGLGNPGDVLVNGQCVTYNVGSGITVKCIASAAGSHLTGLECE
jgi:hypothetical protein